MIRTSGAVSGNKYVKAPWKEQVFQTSPQLRIVVFRTNKARVNAKTMAMLAQSAFDSVRHTAGMPPPVDAINLYLVPSGYAYKHEHRSFSLSKKHRVDYVIPENYGTSFGHSVVREVSHELTHALIGTRQTSQIANERAAVTMESCAVLRAFGHVDDFNEHPLDEVEIGKLTTPSSAAHFTLQAKYANDPALKALLSTGPITQGSPQAHALIKLCRARISAAIQKRRQSEKGAGTGSNPPTG